jgi:hypothetical protein
MRLWHSAIAASGAAPPPRRAGRRPAGSSPPIFGAGSGAGAGERCAVADYGGKVRGERGGGAEAGGGSEWVPLIGVQERFPL